MGQIKRTPLIGTRQLKTNMQKGWGVSFRKWETMKCIPWSQIQLCKPSRLVQRFDIVPQYCHLWSSQKIMFFQNALNTSGVYNFMLGCFHSSPQPYAALGHRLGKPVRKSGLPGYVKPVQVEQFHKVHMKSQHAVVSRSSSDVRVAQTHSPASASFCLSTPESEPWIRRQVFYPWGISPAFYSFLNFEAEFTMQSCPRLN